MEAVVLSGHASSVTLRWLICDNGMTVAAGMAHYDQSESHLSWEGEAPPVEHEGLVRVAIARIIHSAT